MADSVQMINELVAVLEALPKTASGDTRVEDPTSLAVSFVGIVAPIYQSEFDAIQMERDTYQSLARQHENELIGLRADVTNLRTLVATAQAHLNQGHTAEAAAVLGTI